MHIFNPHEPFCFILYCIVLVIIGALILIAVKNYLDDCYRKLEEEEEDIYSDL